MKSPKLKGKTKHNARLALVKFQNPNNKDTILKHVRETKTAPIRKQSDEH